MSRQPAAPAAEGGARQVNPIRPVAIPLPRFAYHPPQQQRSALTFQAPPQQVMQALPMAPQPVPAAAANARGLRFSQPTASQLHAAFPPWSQRSQLDSVLMDEQADDSQGLLDAAGVGSAPQPTADYGHPPSQPEVTRGPAPAQTATRLLNEISRKALNLDAHPLLAGLSAKLEAADGRQSSLEAAVGDLKAGLAQQGSKLDDIANACAQLLQAVQLATGASSSMEERLQALLAKEPCVTGDMATQTSPATELRGRQGAGPAPAAAVVAPEPPGLLQTFSQRRPSSADIPSARKAAPLKPTALPPAAGLQRGLHAATPGEQRVSQPAMPTTFPPLPSHSRHSMRLAAAGGGQAQHSPAAAPAATAAPPSNAATAKPRARAGTGGKSCLSAKPAAAAAAPVASFSRKRRHDSSSDHAHTSTGKQQKRQPAAVRPAPRPQASQQPRQEAAAALGSAEALFDSLFAAEDDEGAGAAEEQQGGRSAAKAAPGGGQQREGGSDTTDLAAAVQARLQQHKSKMARSRRRHASLSRRQQQEDEE
ncbi:hypothetical protein CHLNCDRAFT_135556 [Chlorella variabilis]|uniref:Uncharacterized protein n=1 Tax=Chlorella variabilis TaxID=554065 RepID=E1ZIG0_CHLVA|nr:hypothetical protein CHLNCDRAFT_135556 [Chlorella variabilis]EFN54325.1 hypothetical protein CHLNCDRAFT_135556 [Chlorella variabilis]|eukprot:XP_005846427.1 hypothetical protein CHLNCDRAFT_135556 [Chlorella variabilis]